MSGTEASLLLQLRENADASIRALERNDMVAYRALAEQEVRIMDTLRALWRSRRESE